MKRQIEEPLQEVREWKKEVSMKTIKMSPKETVRYFRNGAEEIWQDYGYRCVPVGKKACKHIKT